MNTPANPCREWLETDGLGGFASGTESGLRTRRYHALLLAATMPPTGRYVLVNGVEGWVETPDGTFPLTSQRYRPDVIHPDGHRRIEGFGWQPWPHWIYRLNDRLRIECEIFQVRGGPLTCLSWRVLGPSTGVRLFVRPLLSGRDYHALHRSNPAFRFDAETPGDRVHWQPYPGLPGITALSNGNYQHHPVWYYNFHYAEEEARGLDATEDLASPGVLQWDLSREPAALLLSTRDHAAAMFPRPAKPLQALRKFRDQEKRRRESFATPLDASADHYLVRRGAGHTVIAGYPWFTDWGRDTFIALRGLCLATGRLEEARSILVDWSRTVSLGMVPNRFPDHGDDPEFNSVDASLWYVVAVHEFLAAAARDQFPFPASDREALHAAVREILVGYARGTRHGIRMDDDGLLSCGEPGVQLTWMDARVGDWVVTPRTGKPVEIQALWLNALRIAGHLDPRWRLAEERAHASFVRRFWNPERQCLRDVVDVDHMPGRVDDSVRPNQILAVGGLPWPVLDGEMARQVVETVERELVTPIGLRSLAPREAGYCPRYAGGVRERDGAYHQGTVWPWLLGPFVEAWVRVRDNSAASKEEARRRFLAPLLGTLETVGLGHLPEVADAEPPHSPGGCPFQAWSLAEAIRLDRRVLVTNPERPRGNGSRAMAGRSAQVSSQPQAPPASRRPVPLRPARPGLNLALTPTMV